MFDWKPVGPVGWLNGLEGAAVFAAEVPKEEGLGCAIPNPEGWLNAEEAAVGWPNAGAVIDGWPKVEDDWLNPVVGWPSRDGWPNDDGWLNVDDGRPKALGCWANAEGWPNVEVGADG